MTPRSIPRLTYFDIRGRAEPIRLLLEELEVPYEDRRVSIEEWPALKPTLPFGQLPIYEEGSRLVPQAQAILRHLARKHDRYGGDEDERIRCDVIAEAVADARTAFSRLLWDPQFDEKRQGYLDKLPATLGSLERCLQQNPGAPPHWVGRQPSYVDALAFAYLDSQRRLAADILSRFPTLSEFKQCFSERPRVASYLQSGRRPPTFTVSLAPFGGTPETS